MPENDGNETRRWFGDPASRGFMADWWKALDSSESEKGEGMHLADRGDRARLRRCRDIDDVLLTPVYYGVRHELVKRGLSPHSLSDRKLAAVVGLLAWIDEDDFSEAFSRQLARRRKDSQDAKLSGLRFRRLLDIEDRNELYHEMIGVLRLLDGKANVEDFARQLYAWGPDSSNWVRRRWAEDYYTAAPDEP